MPMKAIAWATILLALLGATLAMECQDLTSSGFLAGLTLVGLGVAIDRFAGPAWKKLRSAFRPGPPGG
jgi:hypothetical protein